MRNLVSFSGSQRFSFLPLAWSPASGFWHPPFVPALSPPNQINLSSSWWHVSSHTHADHISLSRTISQRFQAKMMPPLLVFFFHPPSVSGITSLAGFSLSLRSSCRRVLAGDNVTPSFIRSAPLAGKSDACKLFAYFQPRSVRGNSWREDTLIDTLRPDEVSSSQSFQNTEDDNLQSESRSPSFADVTGFSEVWIVLCICRPKVMFSAYVANKRERVRSAPHILKLLSGINARRYIQITSLIL